MTASTTTTYTAAVRAARMLGLSELAIARATARHQKPSSDLLTTRMTREAGLTVRLAELAAAMTEDHSASCIDYTTRAVRWFVAWPWACRSCNGQGGKEDVDSSVNYTEFTPCESCLARGTCPRCAKPIKGFGENRCGLPFDYNEDVGERLDEVTCACCGWSLGRSSDDSAPIVFDCDCWERNVVEAEPVMREYTEVDLARELSGVDEWREDEWRNRNARLAASKSRF